LSKFLLPQIGSKIHSQNTLYLIAFGKPAGHGEVASREFCTLGGSRREKQKRRGEEEEEEE
jgi:hypothetical protein